MIPDSCKLNELNGTTVRQDNSSGNNGLQFRIDHPIVFGNNRSFIPALDRIIAERPNLNNNQLTQLATLAIASVLCKECPLRTKCNPLFVIDSNSLSQALNNNDASSVKIGIFPRLNK